ncbi:hypothetical protein DL240_07015 [Lujinxingia litoralis]|uniref:Uncharacterized protein n=1 Tax=Lujinxingia litoralis TaxID=2211119 RepID=A0A328C9S4_9DELT|nr:hypothetical protein DL240_07015 [Lujinxingia litoralis]
MGFDGAAEVFEIIDDDESQVREKAAIGFDVGQQMGGQLLEIADEDVGDDASSEIFDEASVEASHTYVPSQS